MPTMIEREIWDGGSGFSNRRELIGYCKEEPLDVLKQLMFTHRIYKYLDCYRPIDFRDNVEGLIIHKYTDGYYNGLTTKVTGTLNKLDLTAAETPNVRTKEQILDDLELCRKWHTYPDKKKLQDSYWSVIDSIKEYVETL